ncbi:MAG: ABC transporter substrate-binding protein [Chloroflexi bacterium]|nr:ABC transporter substrate-binding protein [Chloroflexota bacterium]
MKRAIYTCGMRICSLLPSATEIVYALGLGDDLVGVSHACDYPDDAAAKPVVSRSVRQITHLSSEEIDAIVRQARINSNPLYWIDGGLLRELKPDLIITQELCEVCAIDSGSVFETAAKVLDHQPEIMTIRPNTVADILQNVRNIAAAAGVAQRGHDLAESLQSRIGAVVDGVAEEGVRPRVLCLDWLDPLRNTGQWVPELVEMAGGEERLAVAGGLSRELTWDEIVEYAPEYLMVMPCAFDPERVRRETSEKLTGLKGWNDLPAVRMDQVFLFDGRIPTRHGPRVVDVLEGLAEAMHPQRFKGISTDEVLVKDRP